MISGVRAGNIGDKALYFQLGIFNPYADFVETLITSFCCKGIDS